MFPQANVTYTVYRCAFSDQDNIWGGIVKVCNDALVNTGIIAGDSPKFITTYVMPQVKLKGKAEKPNQRVEIKIQAPVTQEDFQGLINATKNLMRKL